MKTISIIAATLSGNRGAEAMLTTTIGRIRDRYPEARFNVFSYYPGKDMELLNDPMINIYSATPLYLVSVLFPFSILLSLIKWTSLKLFWNWFPESVLSINDSDVLIDLAGVSFIDGREKFLPYNILTLAPAFILNTPVIKFSQALGPFENPLNRFFAKHTLARCQQVFARGTSTYQHLKSLSIKCLYPQPVADVAFLHSATDTLSKENPQKLANLATQLEHEDRKLIGICPSSVLATRQHPGMDYYQALTTLCHQLLNQGYAVLLYPNATREEQFDHFRNNDLPVINKIVKRISQDNPQPAALYFVDFDINTNSIKQLMSYCRLVMVSRFHAMIAALSTSQPVIVLGWSHKYQEVMQLFNLDDLVFDFKQFDSNGIVDTIDLILSDMQITELKLSQQREAVIASSQDQFNYLFSLLDKKQS
ncbi:MAG: polysaccharide pyruvyl transferase family protein [Candidatus Thiodiazotropha sp. (ex Rostrolucina anterorostrata)]|nr:polysaccharide pyruvyl transferase family protein [Candidatus Thiodiazotropha sp. (ex Rostrolucina anterorostrata)]